MEVLILVGGDKVDPARDGHLPAETGGFERAEAVAFEPAVGVVFGVVSVEGVEADPEAPVVGVIDERLEPRPIGFGPFAGVSLTAFFYK